MCIVDSEQVDPVVKIMKACFKNIQLSEVQFPDIDSTQVSSIKHSATICLLLVNKRSGFQLNMFYAFAYFFHLPREFSIGSCFYRLLVNAMSIENFRSNCTLNTLQKDV